MVTTADLADAARTLGVAPGSDAATVRRAFRRLALRHHPDAGGDAATFRAVREAYDLLVEAAPSTGPSTTPTGGTPVRVVNAYAWAGAPATTVGRWADVAA